MGRNKSSAASGLAALFILSIVSVALFTVYVKEGDCTREQDCGPLHTVQLGAAEVLQPARSVFATLFEPLQRANESVQGAFDNSEEQRLERKLQESHALAAQASRLERENARLRELLKGQRSAYEYGPLAQVVAPVGDVDDHRVRHAADVRSDAPRLRGVRAVRAVRERERFLDHPGVRCG